MTVSLGPEASHRLPSLREGKLVMAEAGRVADRELTLIQEDGTSEVVGEIPLVNASAT